MTQLTDFVVFHDKKLASKYAGRKIPMSTLFEAFLDGDVDIPDMDAFLEARHEIVTFNLTMDHVKQAVTQMIHSVPR